MTDDRSQRARAAADAGTATREQAIREVQKAFLYNVHIAAMTMPGMGGAPTAKHMNDCRLALTACLAHLDELARLIAQRNGYAEAQSLGPDVGERRYG